MEKDRSYSSISKQSCVPLHEQVKEFLLREIEEGRVKQHQRLPSEKSLCARFGVSRITVRQALSELESEGVIQRIQGKGTYVAPKKVDQGLARIVTFSKTVMEMGLRPSTRILDYKVISADVVLSRVLSIPLGSEVSELTLLGVGDDQPLVLYKSCFPEWLGSRMWWLAKKKAKNGEAFSTYDLYREEGLPVLKQIDQTFEVTTTDSELSCILKVGKGFPVFVVTSIFYGSDDKPLEYRRAVYRGDRYRFHITRTVG